MNPYGIPAPTLDPIALARFNSGIKAARNAYDEDQADPEPQPCRDCGRPAKYARRCDLHHRAYRAECSQRARDKKKETRK